MNKKLEKKKLIQHFSYNKHVYNWKYVAFIYFIPKQLKTLFGNQLFKTEKLKRNVNDNKSHQQLLIPKLGCLGPISVCTPVMPPILQLLHVFIFRQNQLGERFAFSFFASLEVFIYRS